MTEHPRDAASHTLARRRLIAIFAAAAIVLGGSIATSVPATAAPAHSRVTHAGSSASIAAKCASAKKTGAAARAAKTAALAKTAVVLKAVKSTKLPGGKGTSTSYTKRPAVKASKTKAARPSGKQFIASVTAARDALKKTTVPATCKNTAQAAQLIAKAKTEKTRTTALKLKTSRLAKDFAAFQASEIKRLAAKKAAEALAAAKKKATSILKNGSTIVKVPGGIVIKPPTGPIDHSYCTAPNGHGGTMQVPNPGGGPCH